MFHILKTSKQKSSAANDALQSVGLFVLTARTEAITAITEAQYMS